MYVIDDDESVRHSLSGLLQAKEIPVADFPTAREFLDFLPAHAAGCALVDLQMPGINGLELQLALADIAPHLPIIFLTGYGDVPSTVRAMKSGAVDFLLKPVKHQTLFAAIDAAFSRERKQRDYDTSVQDSRRRFGLLTAREKQVVHLVAQGLLNKQIAAELGTVEKTIKVHRAHALAKLGITSVAQLVRLMERTSVSLFGSG